jgi:hypothetical protein
MSFRTSEPIDVTLTADGDGIRYFAGPFRSVGFASEDDAAKSIAGRFPKATVDGKPIADRFPILRTIESGTLAPPAPLPMVTEAMIDREANEAAIEKTKEPAPLSAAARKVRKPKAAKPEPVQAPLWD